MGNRQSGDVNAAKVAPDDRPSGRQEALDANRGPDVANAAVVPNGEGREANGRPKEVNGKSNASQAAPAPKSGTEPGTPKKTGGEDGGEKKGSAAQAAERQTGTPTVIWNHQCVMPKRYSQMKVTRQQQWTIPPSFTQTWQLANVGDVNHVMRHYEGTLEPLDSSKDLCGMFAYVVSDIAKQRYEKSCFHVVWHIVQKTPTADPPPRLFFTDRLDDLRALRESPYVQKVLEVATLDWRIFTAVERADGGTLSQLIDFNETIEEQACSKIFKEVFKGMAFLAERRVVHRNMTTTSIMLMDQDPLELGQNQPARAKIGDFAHAILLNVGQTWHILPERERSPKRIPVGDPHIWSWSAANFGWGITSDAWAVGICLHEALLGAFPLMVHKKLEGTRIRLRDFNGPQLEPSDMSSEARDVLLGLLHKSSQERWTMAQCVKCTWVTDPMSCVENHEKQYGPMRRKLVDPEKAKVRQSQVRQSEHFAQQPEGKSVVGNAMNAIRQSILGAKPA